MDPIPEEGLPSNMYFTGKGGWGGAAFIVGSLDTADYAPNYGGLPRTAISVSDPLNRRMNGIPKLQNA